MSGRTKVSRVAVAAGALVVLILGFVVPTTGAAAPRPQVTTATPSVSSSAKATPSATESDTDVSPQEDPTDDGTEPTVDQAGTYIAIGGAAALALLAGLVVVLRRR